MPMVECIGCGKKFGSLNGMACPECIFEKMVFDKGVTGYVRGYKFHPSRKWKFDFAFHDKMIAVEIEGGTWTGGRHTRGKGFENDCIKYNAATKAGWKIFRYTTNMVENGNAIEEILEILGLS